MAEFVVGTVIGVAGLYSVCLQAMENIQDARNLEKDYLKLHTLFESERFLFKAWGNKVRIDVKTGDPHPCLDETSNEYATIHNILENINIMLTDSDKLSKRYGMQKRKSIVNKMIWAVKDKKGFGLLVAEVGAFVQKLYAILYLVEGENQVREVHEKLNDLIEVVTADSILMADEMMKQQSFRQEMTENLSDNKRKELLDWVGGVSTERAYDDIIRARNQGTCSWLDTNEQFVNWLGTVHDTKSRVLWMHGGPGTGKTFISASAIERAKNQSSYPTAYFFCSHENTAQNQALSIIRSWIVQLATQKVKALHVLQSLKNGEPVPSTLWNIFSEILHSVGPCHLVVDGLDECLDLDPQSTIPQRDMVKGFLEELLQSTGPHCANILILSRDLAHIRSGLFGSQEPPTNLRTIHVPIEYCIKTIDTVKDIQSISAYMVQSMNFTASHKRMQIEQNLAAKCEGMFLWLRLAGERLKPGMKNSKITQILESMPAGLNAAYKRDLARIATLSHEDQTVVKDILRWLIFSTRPLSVMELLHALAIDIASGTVTYDDIPDVVNYDVIQTQILSMCGSFVQIRGDPQSAPTNVNSFGTHTVHFVHFSAKEFLLKGTQEPGGTHDGLFFSTAENSHCILTQYSLTYLLSDSVQVVSGAFSPYASLSWMTHWHQSSPEAAGRCRDLQARLFMPGPAFERWREFMVPGHGMNALETASCLNLVEVGRIIVKNPQKYFNTASIESGRALHLAAWGGKSEFLSMLLEQPGVDVNALLPGDVNPYYRQPWLEIDIGWLSDLPGKRPLHFACQSGNMNIVRLLLDREDLDINAVDKSGFTPVLAAIENDHEVIVEELILKGANLHIARDDGNTPLHFAAYNGNSQIVTLLIEDGGSANAVNVKGETPLHHPGFNRAIVELLIARGANLNARDSNGNTPLCNAIMERNQGLTGLLIKHGADLSIGRSNGMTPLHIAVDMRNAALLSLLIENGADVNAVNEKGETPLNYLATGPVNPAWAVGAVGRLVSGFPRRSFVIKNMILSLINGRADVNIGDSQGKTPLQNSQETANTWQQY